MTRKRRDCLGLQPILPKPQNVTLLTKSDRVPVYLFNLPCDQNGVDAEESQTGQPDSCEQIGKWFKRRKISSNSRNVEVECKKFCASDELSDGLNSENLSKNLVSTNEQVIFKENICISDCGDKDTDNSCDKRKSNSNIDAEHFVITENVNNLSNPKTSNLIKCLNAAENNNSQSNELSQIPLLLNCRQEEAENNLVDKSNLLPSRMDYKMSKYKEALETFVKISPCLPETVNKSRNFFTIKKSGKKKFVLCNKTMKKLMKFVPPDYCNNDCCCPNLADIIKTGKSSNFPKFENFNNNSLVQNIPEQKIIIDLNNNVKQSVKFDDEEHNLVDKTTFENDRPIQMNSTSKNVILENQNNLWLNTTDIKDAAIRKVEMMSNTEKQSRENILDDKKLDETVNTTGTEKSEYRHTLSCNLHPKTLAVLQKYRKIAPRMKQTNGFSDEFKCCQTKVQSCVSSSEVKSSSPSHDKTYLEDRTKSNKMNITSDNSKNFKCCCDKSAKCCKQKCQENISDDSKSYKIYSTFNRRKCKKIIYNVGNSSKVALTDISDTDEGNNLQSLTFSELVKLSEKYGEKIFRSLSLDEITRKATIDIFEHNNVSNNAGNRLISDYSITDDLDKNTKIANKNGLVFSNEFNKMSSLNSFSCDIDGINISKSIDASRLFLNEDDVVNFHKSSNFLQENNFSNANRKSEFIHNKLISDNKYEFLKLLDLRHVEEKMLRDSPKEIFSNEEIRNLKNPLVPLHHLFKLVKNFKRKHAMIPYSKTEARRSSLGLMTGDISNNSKFHPISGQGNFSNLKGNVIVSKNRQGKDEAWLLIPIRTASSVSTSRGADGTFSNSSARSIGLPQARREWTENVPTTHLPRPSPNMGFGRNFSAPFYGMQPVVGNSGKPHSVISHCCTVSHHSEVRCSPSSTYHKLS